MKKLNLLVAMLAAIATVIVPVAPANAAPKPNTKAGVEQLVRHAEKGEALILTEKQLKQIQATNRALHAKLMAAYKANRIPDLSVAEKKQLVAVSKQNVGAIKGAGAEFGPAHVALFSGGAIFVLALVIAALVVILFHGFATNSPGARFLRAFIYNMFWFHLFAPPPLAHAPAGGHAVS